MKLNYSIHRYFFILISLLCCYSFAQERGLITIYNKNVSKSSLINYTMATGESIPKDIIIKNFNTIKTCVLDKNIDCISAYFMYSNKIDNGTVVLSNNKKSSVKSQKDLIGKFDKIFTKNVIKAISDQKESILSSSDSGIMIGNGQVWLNYFCESDNNDKCYFKIYTINTSEK